MFPDFFFLTEGLQVSFPDDTFGTESRFGIPFTFLLRDILQFDESLDDTIDRLINAHRTCDLILGTGSLPCPSLWGTPRAFL